MIALLDLGRDCRTGVARLLLCLGVAGLLCACDTPKIKLTPDVRYKPTNVYLRSRKWTRKSNGWPFCP